MKLKKQKGAKNFNLNGVKLEVSQVSDKARKQIEALGGSVKTIYYNRVYLRYLLKVQRNKQERNEMKMKRNE